MMRSIVTLVALTGMIAALTACGPKGSYPEDDPRSAVHQFLRATVGQANGQRACALLTDAARERFDRTLAGSCRNALNTAIVALPGETSTGEGTGRAAEDIDLEADVSGDRATVTASRKGGRQLTFDVVRLTDEQLEAIERRADEGVGSAPQSDWRIDRGAEQLVRVPDQTPGSQDGADAGPDAQH